MVDIGDERPLWFIGKSDMLIRKRFINRFHGDRFATNRLRVIRRVKWRHAKQPSMIRMKVLIRFELIKREER